MSRRLIARDHHRRKDWIAVQASDILFSTCHLPYGRFALVDHPHQRTLVLIAALILSLGLGSIHAFSVLLDPLEMRFSVSRADIAPAYSIGLASLTFAVLIGHRLFRLVSPAKLALLTYLIAAVGLAVASLGTHIFALWVGYGLVFGFANGVGYGFALYLTNLAFDRNRGLAMGSVTAVYAVGASGFAILIDNWIKLAGVDGALIALSTTLALCGVVAGAALWWSRYGVDLADQPSDQTVQATVLDRPRLLLCWLIYGTGVAAGLMAMGHAAGIVTAADGTASDGVRGVIAITFANALGGFSAGYFADRRPAHILLATLGAASALALLMLAIATHTMLVIALLAVVGFTYGATIALFPIVTTLIFGRDDYARAYGKIFTSWGVAGLIAPWLAGDLYSRTDGYGIALLIAAFLAVSSGALSWLLAEPSAGPRTR
ncbi:MAG: MFS transporter [Geminicoccales bacterium]